jgi:hypothetical protein
MTFHAIMFNYTYRRVRTVGYRRATIPGVQPLLIKKGGLHYCKETEQDFRQSVILHLTTTMRNNNEGLASAGESSSGISSSNPPSQPRAGTNTNVASASATMTITETEAQNQEDEVLRLTLRARPSVTW